MHVATEEPGAVVRVRTARVDPAEAVAVASALLPAESARVARAAPVDRPAVALSLLLVRTLAAEMCGLPPDAIRVDRRCPRCGATTHGVPRVRRVDGGRVPQVSLGRCVDRVVVAASAVGSIGVDLERTDAEERARAALGTDGDVPTLRAWARTEALLKAAGTGLAVDPRTVRISDPTGRPQVVGDHPAPPAGTRWWLDDLDLGPAHLGALALALPDGPDPLIATRQIDPADLTP